MYDDKWAFADNPLGRYAIGDETCPAEGIIFRITLLPRAKVIDDLFQRIEEVLEHQQLNHLRKPLIHQLLIHDPRRMVM